MTRPPWLDRLRRLVDNPALSDESSRSTTPETTQPWARFSAEALIPEYLDLYGDLGLDARPPARRDSLNRVGLWLWLGARLRWLSPGGGLEGRASRFRAGSEGVMHQGCRSRAVKRWVRFVAAVGGARLGAARVPRRGRPAAKGRRRLGRWAFRDATWRSTGPSTPGMARSVVGRSISFDESRPNVRSPVPTVRPPDTRGRLNVTAARLDDDGRTLVLTTDPHPRAGCIRSSLPRPSTYDLTGVEAVWDDGGD